MHFFTNRNLLANQGPNQEFGPDTSFPGKFRVTSLHQALNPANPCPAFAVASGRICAIRDRYSSTGLYNIVLQPDQGSQTRFPGVKFFVYRGVMRSSLYNAQTQQLLTDTSPTHILNRIAANATAITNSGGNPGTMNEDQLGHDILDALTAADHLDDIFFGNWPNKVPLPRVTMGDTLGTFRTDQAFGFEVMFDNIGFNPTIYDLEGVGNFGNSGVDPSVTLIDSNASSTFQSAVKKEQILNFCDPCAFYGTLETEGVQSVNGFIPAGQVYGTLLNNRFVNQNIIYIDIRDRTNHSYHLFQHHIVNNSYTQNIELSFGNADPTSPAPADYNAWGWPLLRINGATQLQGTGSFDTTDSFIRLAFPKSSNACESAQIYLDTDHCFLLGTPLAAWSSGGRLYILRNNRPGAYTFGFTVQIPHNGNSAQPVSTYVKMRYVKHYDPCTTLSYTPIADYPIYPTPKDYGDFVFPIDLDMRWTSYPTNILRSNVFYEGTFLDDSGFGGTPFMANIGIAEDGTANSRVTFFAFDPTEATAPTFNQKGLVDRTFGTAGVAATYFNDNLSFLQNLQNNVVPFNLNPWNLYFSQTAANNNNPDFTINEFFFSSAMGAATAFDMTNPMSVARNMTRFRLFDMTSAEYTTIKTQAQGLSNLVDGLRVYLGLRIDSTGTSFGNGTNWIRYEYMLRFIKKQSGSHVFHEVGTGVYTYKRNIVFNPTTNLPNTVLGQSHAVTVDGTGLQSIQCTVYLAQAPNLTDAQFCLFRNYVIQNIQSVWSTATTPGLTAPPVPGPNPGAMPLPLSNITATTVNFCNAGPAQFQRLNANEVLVVLNGAQGRSNIGAQRVGTFFWDNISTNPNTYVPQSPNTPAHEFGHVLGLTDRYTYVAQINPTTCAMVQNYGRNVGAFIPWTYDPFYVVDFRWRYNLYSTSRTVPQVLTDPNEVPWLGVYQNQNAVFITPTQWNIVVNNLNESNANPNVFQFTDQYVYFIANTPPQMSTPDWIGVEPVNNTIVTDHNSASASPIMDQAAAPNQPRNSGLGLGLYSPYVGNNPLTSGSSTNGILGQELTMGRDTNLQDNTRNLAAGVTITRTMTAATETDFNARGASPVNTVGFCVWNDIVTTPQQTIGAWSVFSNNDNAFHAHSITWTNEYQSRTLILRLIDNGTLP